MNDDESITDNRNYNITVLTRIVKWFHNSKLWTTGKLKNLMKKQREPSDLVTRLKRELKNAKAPTDKLESKL